MKLYTLSARPEQPCFLLKFKGTTIMLDCGLDISSLMHYLPLPLTSATGNDWLKNTPWQPNDSSSSTGINSDLAALASELRRCEGGKILVDGEPEFCVPEIGMFDVSEIDVILISNFHTMLALPYITEFTEFSGVIYATEPTLHFGRMLMEELVKGIDRGTKSRKASHWKDPLFAKWLPASLRDLSGGVRRWKSCYNMHNVNSCVNKIEKVSFSESKEVYGALRVTASSSGYCLGASNWIIRSAYEKIVYLSRSSTLTTHPKPIEQHCLRDSDVLILSGITQRPNTDANSMINEFCVNTALTLKSGGNVLVPCAPAGGIFDLFECLSNHLDNCGLSQIPYYFISSVANCSLAYSNIYGEWLAPSKQSKIYLPECPFPHAELLRVNRLRQYNSIDDISPSEMRTPCVVFTGHYSLRFGDVVHLLKLWGSSPRNTILFTEPDFDYLDALAPYQPLTMKALYCPIDTSLSYAQANTLLKELKCKHIVLPDQYCTPPPLYTLRHQQQQSTASLVIDPDLPLIPVHHADVLKLPVKRQFEQVKLAPELANQLVPIEIQPEVSVSMISGQLKANDHSYKLEPIKLLSGGRLPKGEEVGKSPPPAQARTHLYGALNARSLVSYLQQRGITARLNDSEASLTKGRTIIELPQDNMEIRLEGRSTHVIGSGSDKIRYIIRDALVNCLNKL